MTETTPSPPQSALTFEQAFVRLKSRHVGERIEAELALQSMGPSAVEGLLSILEREQAKRRSRRRLYFGIATLYSVVAIPLVVYVINTAISQGNPGLLGALGGILGGGGGGILGGFAWLLAPTPKQALANSVLARIEDKRAVGPLLLALQSFTHDPFARTSAGMALLKIAHQLHENDETYLDAEQRACLNKAIRARNPAREADLLAGLLVLAAKVGDHDTLNAIQPLTERTPANDRDASVVRMARESYAQLMERLERSRDSATLLRPISTGATDTLLRPMQSGAATDEQQLLRPSATDA